MKIRRLKYLLFKVIEYNLIFLFSSFLPGAFNVFYLNDCISIHFHLNYGEKKSTIIQFITYFQIHVISSQKLIIHYS